MNFVNVIKAIFPTPPTLDEFINAHNPQSILEVEALEKRWEDMMLRNTRLEYNQNTHHWK